MMFKKPPFYFIYALILITACTSWSCSTSSRVADEPAEAVEAAIIEFSELDRPVPNPIEIPDAFRLAIENETRTSNGYPGPAYWQNTAHYTMHAEIDPSTHTLSGSSSVTYYNNSPDDLEVIIMELAQNLHKAGTPKKDLTEITGGTSLEKVIVNGSEVPEISWPEWWTQRSSGYIVEGTRMYVFPDDPVISSSSADFEFEWSFTIPQDGASGRMGRSRDNLYFIAYWYPQINVYDDVYGWMSDDFLGNAEFYHPFADYQLEITMPQDWIVMATGEFLNPGETLAPETLSRYLEAGNSDEPVTIVSFADTSRATAASENGTLTWKFSAERIRDVAFSATKASQWDGARTPVGDPDNDGVTDYTRINSFYRESAPLWTAQASYARHAITFFSEYTDLEYPWYHMTSVEGAGIIGGGMEFPMMTVIGDYNSAGATRLYGVTAHELAHMWFPMIINTNERRYAWIDEGHTTFHTNEANKDFFGDQFTHDDVFSGYLQIAGTDMEGEIMRWSDYHYPGPAYGVASYPKPASVLIALRGVLGEEVFNEAHREVVRRWNYRHAYPWDIMNTFEDVSGRDLSWFWRPWYYETWTLNHTISDVLEDGGNTIIRVQDLGNVPMPLTAEITLRDGSVVRESVEVEHWLHGHTSAAITLEGITGIQKVVIDPGNHFPYHYASELTWERNS
ncbi:M1 family metallopeptidase [Rhodohalobacter mucosus]|uniref:Peptidase n=1 Tax=Rhodohalobacter mucosus TaxID=2079485 RepID=A0A316TXR6_9BACT|nr:M1 family metallopeptidase [Rhodohalobacter mucosus]PWN08125.1 peptidase [Rhodohalobacter mucosus]